MWLPLTSTLFHVSVASAPAVEAAPLSPLEPIAVGTEVSVEADSSSSGDGGSYC